MPHPGKQVHEWSELSIDPPSDEHWILMPLLPNERDVVGLEIVRIGARAMISMRSCHYPALPLFIRYPIPNSLSSEIEHSSSFFIAIQRGKHGSDSKDSMGAGHREDRWTS